jgi:tyrosyl-tRNA synthetase
MDLVLKEPTEEVITAGELRELFQTKERPTHYIGFEISGPLHLGSLVVAGFKLRDFLKAGIRVQVFLADWHSYINDKLGGDWERIKRAAGYYRRAFETFAPGVEVILGSDLYEGNDEYWRNLIRFSKHVTLRRATRTLTIMGRTAKETIDIAQYIYPSMQAVDIKTIGADIAHAGMDQRKVHMLAREVYPKLGWTPPIAVHHHLLPGLDAPTKMGLDEDEVMDEKISSKMSKSKPWTAIFIHDSEEEVERKLIKAWCPERKVEGNPILEITRHIVFHEKEELEVERPAKYGGDITFCGFEELRKDYEAGKLHPLDLKRAVAKEVNRIIDPVRRLFRNDKGYISTLVEE